ncbi:MAG: ribosomal protein [Burkholderiales bacterium]|jgi:small subunit ribosomal protein S2|nr:ribosomal protein [Burkholderiales bacterium]
MSVSMKSMLEAGVHFGHQTKFWNPKMKPYIFGARNKIHIINLDKTVVLFDEAIKFIKQTAKNKGTVLFVGTRSQASEIIEAEAKRAGQPFVNHRWLGGMLTNFETVKKSIKKLETKQELLGKSSESGLSKKELLDLNRSIAKLQSSIGGISEMKNLPSAIFIVDTGCHNIAILEAKKLNIPVIGVVDTNNDPSQVDYVIPGNDDSAQAITLYASAVADAIISGKESVITDLVTHTKLEMVGEGETDAKPKTVRRVKKATANDSEAAPAAEETAAVEAAPGEATEEKTAAKTRKPKAKKAEEATTDVVAEDANSASAE